MSGLKPPTQLSMDGNVSDNFKKWIGQYDIYELASGVAEKTQAVRCATFLHVAGPRAQEIYRTLPEVSDIKALKKTFTDYCTPQRNLTYIRHVFFTRVQCEGEKFERYLTDLKSKADECEFGELKDSLIKDRIVCGVRNDVVRERLLRDSELTLDIAASMCRAAELSEEQAGHLHHGEFKNVHAVKQQYRKSERQYKNKPSENQICTKCSHRHDKRKCPAYGKECYKCKGVNHFAACCKNKSKNVYRKQVNTVASAVTDSDSDEPHSQSLFVGVVDRHDKGRQERKEMSMTMNIGEQRVKIKLDTGAQCNVMSEQLLKEIAPDVKVNRTKVKLQSYSGHEVKVIGKVDLLCDYKKKHFILDFFVCRQRVEAVLGLETCLQLDVVRQIHSVNSSEQCDSGNKQSVKQSMCEQYPRLFEGVGLIAEGQKIKLKEGAEPVIHAPRRVPHSLKGRLQEELGRLENLGIITKQQEATEWVSSMVVTEKKNGQLRICIDPKDLNKGIMREQCQLPMKTDIIDEMTGAQMFTKLDASAGFYQIGLDEDSSKLTCFNTPFGRYRYLRLPMGLASSPEIFHTTMTKIIQDVEGARVFVDDIVIWGKDEFEHDKRLKLVLKKLVLAGVTLNKDKCEFKKDKIIYLGEEISKEGTKPAREKIQAIHDMCVPENKKELQRALGLINYVGRYIPMLSQRTKNMRTLLRNDIQWIWEKEHENEWNDVKDSLTREPVLKFFDSNKDIKISSDSSKDGMGCVLLQPHDGEWMPVAYGSRVLTAAEKNYAQIEKEMLAVVYGCEKFHTYIYGQHVTIETDHKPLIAIHKKTLNETPPRVQRLLLRIQKYDLSFTFTPGKYLTIADTLSRSFSPIVQQSSTDEDVQVHINMIRAEISVSMEKWKQIAIHTEQDWTLQGVKRAMYEGGLCPEPFTKFIEVISEVDGVLLKGDKVIVPEKMRAEMLERVHEGHMGIGKCKARARQVLYWPGMNTDIENRVKSCDKCARFQYQQQKEPLIQHIRPDKPWYKVGSDLFYYGGNTYLLVVDYFSRFPEIALLKNDSSCEVITQLKSIFARHGIPAVLVSDNGPQYNSYEFQRFAKQYEFIHNTSSPYYPQSNGMAEVTVKTVKRILKKNCDPYLALLEYRNTPLEDTGQSPAEMLLGRRLRTKLTLCDFENHMGSKVMMNRKERNVKVYDAGARELKPLEKGETVRMWEKRNKQWRDKAVVVDGHDNERQYKVLGENQRVYIRNRRHLRHTAEEYRPQPRETGVLDERDPVVNNNDNVKVPETNEEVRRSERQRKPPRRLIEE